jgi:hypothetical protein
MKNLLALFLVSIILINISCGGGGSGGSDGDSNNVSPAIQVQVEEAIQEIAGEETQKTIDLYSVPFTVRAASDELIPALSQLIELGSDATDVILDEFRRPPTLYDDVRISILAYALEQIGDERAAPILADWLEEYMFVHSVGWPTDFVTHTIKVLTDQDNLNTHSYTYLIDEKFDTILQVPIEDQHSGNQVAIQPEIFRNSLSSKPPNNRCEKTIRISGIDFNGDQTFREISYNVVEKDFNQLSEDPSYSDDERAIFKKLIKNWKEIDENNYGGTTYIPAEGATYTNASNCGGSVTEIIANEIFLKLNIPMTLTKGSADPESIAEVASTFGTEVGLDEIDKMTVISFERHGVSQHVEIPVDVSGDSATILSKDDKGKVRYHEVDIKAWFVENQFEPVVEHLTKDTPFFGFSELEIEFYRIDPTRITGIEVDSSHCPTDPGDDTEVKAIHIRAKNIKVNAVIHYSSEDQHYVGEDTRNFFSETDEPSSFSNFTFYQSYTAYDGNKTNEMSVTFNPGLTEVIKFYAESDTTVTGDNIPGGSYNLMQTISGTSTIDVDPSNHRLFKIAGAEACDKIDKITFSQTGEGVSNWEVLGVAEEGCDENAELTIEITTD